MRATPLFLLTNDACGREPIYLRHLHIHDDQVIAVPLPLGDSFFTVMGHVTFETLAFQDITQNLACQDIILRYQDPSPATCMGCRNCLRLVLPAQRR